MPRSDAQKKADAKYHAKTYRPFTVNAKIAEYEIIDDYCEKTGISKNQLVITSCMDWIERHPIDNKGIEESE